MPSGAAARGTAARGHQLVPARRHPELRAQAAARGVELIDCPVSGRRGSGGRGTG